MYRIKDRIKSKLFNVPRWVLYPQCLQVDTHNYCNLSCVHCNVKQDGSFNLERGAIKDETYIKLIEYFKNSRINVANFMNGEPLLEPRLDYFNNIAGRISKSRIILDSNGTLYEERYKLLNEHVKIIRITINSYNADTYELIHGKRLLNEAIKTLSWLKININDDVELSINHIVNKYNVHELEQFLKVFRGYDINVFPVHYGDLQIDSVKSKTDKLKELFRVLKNGDIVYPNRIKVMYGEPCQCFNILGIGQKGEIMQCIDFPSEYNYGTIYDTDILDAWNERLKNGMDNECCNNCSVRFDNWKDVMNKYDHL